MPYTGKSFWISTIQGDQFRPDVAYLAARNRYLVVWRGPTGGIYGTLGKLVESDTTVGNTDIAISSGAPAPGSSTSQAVGHVALAVNDGQGSALVVWSQGGAAPSTSDIYGRFLDADGGFVSSPFQINMPADPVGYDTNVRAAWNAKTNLFLVAWEGPNDAGCSMPYGVVLDANGNVKHAVMVGDLNKSETYTLYAVTAHPGTGKWLVAFDKFCRTVDFDGTLGDLSTPPPIYGALNIRDALATPAGYVVIGSAPYLSNLSQVWGATLSADGQNFGPQTLLQSVAALWGARVAFIPKSKDWVTFVSLQHNLTLPAELWCRRFDLQFADLDGKPYGVIHNGDYELGNGFAAHAVNTSDTEVLVVWSFRGHRFDTVSNHIRGAIVETQPGLIIVLDEYGVPVPDARVWVNDQFAGPTNASGWIKCPLRAGDKIAATALVYERPSVKNGHVTDGAAWAYHVWLTSVEIRSDGSAFLWSVVDPEQDQILTVRKKQTLIGFNLVVSVPWSPMQSDLDYIKQLIHDASNRMYNATDGQFFVEHVTFGEDELWSEADMRVFDGTGQPDTLNKVIMKDSYIQMYRLGQGGSVDSGDYVHELFHYFCDLYDEYEEDGPKDAVCTLKLVTDQSGPYASHGQLSSCPMSGTNADGPAKLCTSLPENPHNTNTRQGKETCWHLLYRLYSMTPSWAPQSDRWHLVQPTDPERQRILPGPTAMPCAGWTTVHNPTTSAGSEGPEGHGRRSAPHRPPFPSLASSLKTATPGEAANEITIEVTDAHGRPTHADLWLEHDFGVRRLGRTDAQGRARVSRAAAGKTIRATSYEVPDDRVSHGKVIVRDEDPRQAVAVQPQRVALTVRVRPTVSPMTCEILVGAPGDLAKPPMVIVTPHGARASTLVPMAFEERSSCYRGVFTDRDGAHDGGVVCATVNPGAEDEAISLIEYQVVKVTGGSTRMLLGGDGYSVLALGRHTASDTVAMLTRRTLPQRLPPNTELIGGPYELATTTRFVDGVIRIVPHAAIRDEDVGRLEILRSHENTPEWEALPTFWHPREQYVGGAVDITQGQDPRGVYVAVRRTPEGK